jgi:hypothetical protein
MSKNAQRNARTKHIDIKYHFTGEKVQDGTVMVQYCPTDIMLADFLTKGLPRDRFEKLRSSASILDTDSLGSSGSVEMIDPNDILA